MKNKKQRNKLIAASLAMILSLSMLVPVHASSTDFTPTYNEFKTAENGTIYAAPVQSGPLTSTSGSEAYYKLKVNEAAAYNIYSISSMNPIGALYTKTGVYPFNWSAVELAYDNNGGDGFDFMIEYDMDTFQSYWLAVRAQGTITGQYSFVFEKNLDTETMEYVPEYITDTVNSPAFDSAWHWSINEAYKDNTNIHEKGYYTADELEYIHQVCTLEIMDDLVAFDDQLTRTKTVETLGSLADVYPVLMPDVIGTFVLSKAGKQYGALDENGQDAFEADLRSLGIATLNANTGRYEFQKSVLITYYKNQTVTKARYETPNETVETYYGVEGVRGTWQRNYSYPWP